MKPSILIVGTGIGGCVLADQLLNLFDVTMLEIDARSTQLQSRMVDVGRPAVTDPHLASGLGGTTQFWHNGLIEIDDSVFRKYWPFPKSDLDPYYARAFEILGGGKISAVLQANNYLKKKLLEIGFPADVLGNWLFYPDRRINIWKKLNLASKVTLLRGEAISLVAESGMKLSSIRMVDSGGKLIELEADIFCLSCGGLGTPILLQGLQVKNPSLKFAGCYYEDHPSSFIGEINLRKKIYKLWNLPTCDGFGKIRIPIKIEAENYLISFQLRPANQLRMRPKRERFISVLGDLRNRPFNPKNYIRLLFNLDDIIEIASLKLGLLFPTTRYTLVLVASHPSSSNLSIWSSSDRKIFSRNWQLPKDFERIVIGALETVIKKMGEDVESYYLFPGWMDTIFSSSHHSGTAKMGNSSDDGVTNSNGRVFGFENLYVCDGSLIPASGYANTGLTIGALALRLGDFLNKASKEFLHD